MAVQRSKDDETTPVPLEALNQRLKAIVEAKTGGKPVLVRGQPDRRIQTDPPRAEPQERRFSESDSPELLPVSHFSPIGIYFPVDTRVLK
jgi:hypothetical protein